MVSVKDGFVEKYRNNELERWKGRKEIMKRETWEREFQKKKFWQGLERAEKTEV